MGSEKRVFRRSLTKVIFSIIVSLLFFRSITFCQEHEEFTGPNFEMDQKMAKAQFQEELISEALNEHDGVLPSTLGQTEPESLRSVPIPPVGVTLFVFASAMAVGWLRRRTPS
jgi:hypothetical protein